MIDAFATHPHLVAHLAPIYTRLTPEERGTFYVTTRLDQAYAQRLGVEAAIGTPRQGTTATLVASHHDLTEVNVERPLVYVEHGAGQAYKDRPAHPSYSGGGSRERVALFLTLNDETAQRERVAYPDTPVAVIGSPRMEALCVNAWDYVKQPRPVVAYCPHWSCDLVPETRWSFPEWRHELTALAKSGTVTLLGHGHPRAYPSLVQWYEEVGIEPVRDLEDVVARADLVITDNSSVGPEFAAATGRPVLWLNSAGYRKDVEHRGRFWTWIGGQVMLEPGYDLMAGVCLALDDLPMARESRARMVSSVYGDSDGGAARRGVEAIRREGLV